MNAPGPADPVGHSTDAPRGGYAPMELVQTAVRLLMAALLLLSGVAKVWDAGGTRVAVQDFGVPARLAPAISIAVPLLEIAAGLALPWAATGTEAAIGATLLLGAFAVTMALNLAAGRTPDCHCFGRVHSKPVSWKTFG